MNNETIIGGLKILRNHIGYTQEQVANIIGVDQPTYSNYESCAIEDLRKNLTISQVLKLTEFYDLKSVEETIFLIEGRYNEFFRQRCKRLISQNSIGILYLS